MRIQIDEETLDEIRDAVIEECDVTVDTWHEEDGVYHDFNIYPINEAKIRMKVRYLLEQWAEK